MLYNPIIGAKLIQVLTLIFPSAPVVQGWTTACDWLEVPLLGHSPCHRFIESCPQGVLRTIRVVIQPESSGWVPVHYRVIWNRVQLFGDYNTRVHVAHECVIITKMLHSIPYDTVTHWNEVINTYLHRQLTCSFSTFFPHQRQWQWKQKCSRRVDFPRHIPSWSWTCREYNYIVPRHSEKDSSKQIRFLCDYNFVGWCNFIINLYKQQQNIDSLSSKGWFMIIFHQALLC